MPDVSGIPAIDVLIGLFFLYFVLSLACSALNELIAQLINLRARTLQAGVRNLLGDEQLTKDFFDHPRLQALSKPAGRFLRARGPSYIPSRVFALTLLDTLAPPPEDGKTSRDLAPRARKALKDADVPERVKTMLRDALDEGGAKRDRFRAELERSFDEGMDRVSGWYKRRTQVILLVIALAVVGVTNADSFVIAQRLWKDDALRGAVAAQAAAVVEGGDAGLPRCRPRGLAAGTGGGVRGRRGEAGHPARLDGSNVTGWRSGAAGEARRSPPDCADAVARRVVLVRPALEGRPAAGERPARATEGDARRRSSRGGRGQGDR